ncbi:unnamed protein product [Auanema sp. JU1783]|nr:unnamed protein product [Auanema sp. JU1783]
MMMFGRKKEKVNDDTPVIIKKPPVPPKRTIINNDSFQTTLISSSNAITTTTSTTTSVTTNYSSPYTTATVSSNVQFQAGPSNDVSSTSNDVPTSLFGIPKDFGIKDLSLPSLAPVQVKIRKLKLQKGIGGDFGFTIRRVQFPVGTKGELRTVVFAEPTEIHAGPPRPDDIKNGLLPGDQLLEIDGRRVDSLSREELHELVRLAGQTIELVVKAVPELAEFCDRRRGVRDGGDALLLSNIDTNVQSDIPEDQRYWLVHKGGYTLVRLDGLLGDGRAKIHVAGQSMVVDSTDIDRANPSRLDRAPDVAHLPYINETSAVHLLRQRIGSNLQYSNAGSQSLLCVTSIDGVETAAQERLVHLFKGCRRGQMPAHIYATAQQVYRNLQMTGLAQSVVLTGATGSGKSTQLRNLVHYLSSVAGWTKALTFDKLALVLGVLEAFGHCATPLHTDSTRFVHLFSLGFDKVAALKSARVQACLLESDRVHRRPDGESSFHVFYYLWEGADGALREKLQLDSIENPTIRPFHRTAEREKAKEAFNHLLGALVELGFDEVRMQAVLSVLSAILHLHAAGSTPGSAQKAMFLRTKHAQIAAGLLGVSVEDLTQAVFRGKSPSTQVNLNSVTNRLAITSRGPDGPEALVAFASSLYQELFIVVLEQLNKALASNTTCTFISVLDYPGSTFHSEWVEGARATLGLNDLVFNYINERVAELFHDASFTEPQEVYSREQVDVHVEKPVQSPHDMNRLLDQKQQLLTCTDIDRRSEERRGLMAILEEESMFPGATDDSLLERLFVHLGDESKLIRRGTRSRQIILNHAMGAYPVTYNIEGWVKQAQPCESTGVVRPLLTSSKSENVGALFTIPQQTADMSKLRRATQVAQMELAAKRAPSGFLAYINSQIDYVFSSLRRAPRSHFVHCVQPTAAMRTASDIVDVPFMRSQMRSVLLIDSIRANNRGFPERVPFRDFRRRFGCLVEENASSLDEALDDRTAVARILEKMDIHQHRYRLGMSQVLLASDVLTELEDRRELSLSGFVTALQRECRRHLAQKWIQRRRVLETAIRCIQKNGCAYMKVREWQWWKLYTRVVPLLAATRSDQNNSEWEARLRQLEKHLSDMRASKNLAEEKVEELEETLARETQSAQETASALERETQARIQLERRLEKWRDGGMGDDVISRVSSSAQLESEDREKKSEIVRMKEMEEQARVKAQRAIAQLQDVEAELNKVRARNEILEKKQDQFDQSVGTVEKQLHEMKTEKEAIEKEKEEHQMNSSRRANEIMTLKNELTDIRTVVSRLRREAEERDGNISSSDEAAVLQKEKRDLEQKIREQEEEMDDLAGQNHLLQQSVTRLEMGAERLKTDLGRESNARETEIDELRAQYQRRLRGMEDQLADAQDKHQTLQAENRLLETRLRKNDITTHNFELSGGHYRRELRKALALLADTQALLAHERESAPSQALIRQLREQLEDAEAARTSALKSRHNLESELNEVRALLDQTMVAKNHADERISALLRDRNSGAALVQEKDEQLQSVLKKYKQALQQNQIDHITINDYVEQIADLEKAKAKLECRVNDLESELEFNRIHMVEKHRLVLAEQKIKDTESKVELEAAHKLRLESMVIKLTDEVESLTEQTRELTTARDKEIENVRKTKKESVLLQESIEEWKKRELDAAAKQKTQRDDTERLEEQIKVLQNDQRLSQKRIEALQAALSEGLGEDDDEESDLDERDDLGTGISVL